MEKTQVEVKPYAMSLKEAAIYIGRSEKTLRRLIKSGRLKAKKMKTTITIGRNDFIIKTVDLETWVDIDD